MLTNGARSSIDLGGLRNVGAPADDAPVGIYGDATAQPRARPGGRLILRRGERRSVALGEAHYRRTEATWREAEEPGAEVSLEWTGRELRVAVDVRKAGEPIFVPDGATNRYDNEPADINGDGLQLYLRRGDARGAWVIVPRDSAQLRVRPISGWTDLEAPTGTWRRTEAGYAIELSVPVGDETGTTSPLHFDVIVNEIASGRERRRGQLVLSGADGEFAYLTGDRHDPSRLLPLVLQR
jgi:hypothetical protein